MLMGLASEGGGACRLVQRNGVASIRLEGIFGFSLPYFRDSEALRGFLLRLQDFWFLLPLKDNQKLL
ncbi:hypothetical protein VNO77_44638 [Canavalia gladiata]|uniref:Uncharacterized protein n=1 Tax=Canavalia gladiata TaxID=3824 RepID=A0AAN9JYG3_CANGL